MAADTIPLSTDISRCGYSGKVATARGKAEPTTSAPKAGGSDLRPSWPRYHARRKFGYRDKSLSSRCNSKIVTIGYHGFLRTALSHRYNDWMCVHHVHSL